MCISSPGKEENIEIHVIVFFQQEKQQEREETLGDELFRYAIVSLGFLIMVASSMLHCVVIKTKQHQTFHTQPLH